MYDVIIIGAGPGGLTAGLYAGRFRMKTLILEKTAVGGQIITSATIENYPGFPGGISSFELMRRMVDQAKEAGAQIESAQVTGLETDSSQAEYPFKVKTAERDFSAKSVIVASGAQWKRLGIPGEEKFVGRGVSFCATCDAPFFRNKEVVVVGGGDKAIEEAIFLTAYAAKVTVIHRRKELRAAEILQEKAKANPRISFFLDSVVEEISGENKVAAVKVKNVLTGVSGSIACQGVFIFVGIKPCADFLKKQLATDAAGFIITDDKMICSIDGVFACGDCRAKNLYQVVTACGDAAQAAFSAHNYLLHGK
ncbi:MAG: thioredoxin-disulfide reductase [Candidatus Omnitrophica bacterium]|nr:thioredoxin-disulfide reductase [Candidatus Omnitrophota bacterium]